MRRRIALCWLMLSLSVVFWPATVAAQAQNPEAGLTVEEVVRLTRAGFSEDIIITKIKKSGKAFDLNTDELVDLKKAGVSDNVIKYMLDPSQPYTPAPNAPAGGPATTKPAGSVKKYPEDAFASRVPAEPGLYFFAGGGTPAKIDLKFLLGTEEGKGLMKKGKTIAYLVSPAAKSRIRTTPVFYVRLPEGKEIEELVLLVFSLKNGRRELDVGPPGPKQQLRAEAIRSYESLEAGPRLYKLTAGKLAAGEYSFFFVGSADPAKGIYGKCYDFGVDAVGEEKKK